MSTLMKNDKTIAGLVETEKSNLGAIVDISQYTSSNLFTIPNDGYVILQCSNATNSQAYLMTGNDVVLLVARSNGYLYGHNSIYVRKGMKVYCGGTDLLSAQYIPFQ